MQPKLRTMALASVVALGGLLGNGARTADAQVIVNTPGFSLGVGTPYVGVYPAYGVYRGFGYPPVVAPYPVVRPYGYPYVGPRFYGPRPFYGYRRGYGYGGYRRW